MSVGPPSNLACFCDKQSSGVVEKLDSAKDRSRLVALVDRVAWLSLSLFDQLLQQCFDLNKLRLNVTDASCEFRFACR